MSTIADGYNRRILLSSPRQFPKISRVLNHDGFFLVLLIVLQLLPVLQFRRDPFRAATTHHNLASASYGKSYPASSYPMHGLSATFQQRLVAGSQLYTVP